MSYKTVRTEEPSCKENVLKRYYNTHVDPTRVSDDMSQGTHLYGTKWIGKLAPICTPTKGQDSIIILTTTIPIRPCTESHLCNIGPKLYDETSNLSTWDGPLKEILGTWSGLCKWRNVVGLRHQQLCLGCGKRDGVEPIPNFHLLHPSLRQKFNVLFQEMLTTGTSMK